MEEEFDTPKVNFVPCVKIVRQGASKSNPVQVDFNYIFIYQTLFKYFLL